MGELNCAVVAYLPGPLGEFVDSLRGRLNPRFAHWQAHVSILPPRPLPAGPNQALAELREKCLLQEPFEAELSEVLTFWPANGVVYLSISTGSERLVALHELLNGGPLGWVEPYSYVPHVTIAQELDEAETRAALDVARVLPYRFLVVHLGMPSAERQAVDDNHRDAARRSLEETVALAAAVGVRVAVEVIPNALSRPDALVELVEEQFEGLDVGICLDYGHAHLMGDLGEAIETISGHLWTTHVHDNHGREDEHLVPFNGTIDWDAAMMATQKIGYDGMLMLEVADTGNPIDVLRTSAAARERLEKTFVTF